MIYRNKHIRRKCNYKIARAKHCSLIPLDHLNKPVFSGIRNPFSWYVSWFTHARKIQLKRGKPDRMSKGGSFYKYIMSTLSDDEVLAFRGFYDLVSDFDYFIFGDEAFDAKSEGFASSMVKCMTKRHISDISMFYRFENIEEDLIKILTNIGVAGKEGVEHISNWMREEYFNKSDYKISYRDLYTDEMVKKIIEKDSYIFERFGYAKGIN